MLSLIINIFYIKITLMRIIQLMVASSPAHIGWHTLSQFLRHIKSHSSYSSRISIPSIIQNGPFQRYVCDQKEWKISLLNG